VHSSKKYFALVSLVLAELQEVEKRESENFLDESFLSEVSAQLRQVRTAKFPFVFGSYLHFQAFAFKYRG
jgi:hypothetical protein